MLRFMYSAWPSGGHPSCREEGKSEESSTSITYHITNGASKESSGRAEEAVEEQETANLSGAELGYDSLLCADDLERTYGGDQVGIACRRGAQVRISRFVNVYCDIDQVYVLTVDPWSQLFSAETSCS
jgi:hypothetical protein